MSMVFYLRLDSVIVFQKFMGLFVTCNAAPTKIEAIVLFIAQDVKDLGYAFPVGRN